MIYFVFLLSEFLGMETTDAKISLIGLILQWLK